MKKLVSIQAFAFKRNLCRYTQRVAKAASGMGYEPIGATSQYVDEKTLFAHCTVKQKGICLKKRCGGRLTKDDLAEESTFLLAGYKCPCTTAVVGLYELSPV